MATRATIFEELTRRLWHVLVSDEEVAMRFPPDRRRDFGSLFGQPLDISAADCPLLAVRLASIGLDNWANNKQLDIPVVYQIEAWLALASQNQVLRTLAAVLQPLIDQLDARFGLPWVTDIQLGQANLLAVAELSEEQTRLGVVAGFRIPITVRVQRDPRDGGLYL